MERARLALALLFLLPGNPTVYYGEEVGMAGGKDPENRGGMVWEEARWQKDLRETVKRLARLRKEHPALRTAPYLRIYAQDGHLAFARGPYLAVVNASPHPFRQDFPCTGSSPGGKGGGPPLRGGLHAPGGGSAAPCFRPSPWPCGGRPKGPPQSGGAKASAPPAPETPKPPVGVDHPVGGDEEEKGAGPKGRPHRPGGEAELPAQGPVAHGPPVGHKADPLVEAEPGRGEAGVVQGEVQEVGPLPGEVGLDRLPHPKGQRPFGLRTPGVEGGLGGGAPPGARPPATGDLRAWGATRP